MAKYDCSFSFEVGKKKQTFACCCPDEATFLEVKRALNASMAAIDSFREWHPHDVAVAAPGHKGELINLHITVTRDGDPHIGPTDFPLHDVPKRAVQEVESQWKAFITAPCVAGCKAK